MLIGSTTIRVLRESTVPILAVKKRDAEGTMDIRNILVPLDVYEKADSALNYAMDLALKIKANISVVYAFRPDYYATLEVEIPPNIVDGLIEDEIRLSSTELTKRVEEARSKLKIDSNEAGRLENNTEVVQGISTSTTIVDYATNKNTDLIVINTHGRKGLKRFILGSVAEKVIQESHCAVLVLKP